MVYGAPTRFQQRYAGDCRLIRVFSCLQMRQDVSGICWEADVETPPRNKTNNEASDAGNAADDAGGNDNTHVPCQSRHHQHHQHHVCLASRTPPGTSSEGVVVAHQLLLSTCDYGVLALFQEMISAVSRCDNMFR